MIAGIPISKDLLTLLSKKLEKGNLRNIQLNCLPLKAKYKFDLTDLNVIQRDYAYDFITELLDPESKFGFKLSFSNQNSSFKDTDDTKRLSILKTRLNHLVLQSETDLAEFGYETFGFGFPVITLKPDSEPNKIIKAPLFIWRMRIRKNSERVNSWILQRNSDYEIEYNRMLRAYIRDTYGFDIDDLDESVSEAGSIDEQTVIEYINSFYTFFSEKSGFESASTLFDNDAESLVTLPEKATIEKKAQNTPTLYIGGIFGRFNQKGIAIQEEHRKFPELQENYDDGQDLVLMSHAETAQSTDPSQTGILNYLKENRHLVIQGPPGTGKSRTLTSIILNALEQKKRVLVVCEKKTAMEVLAENLAHISTDIRQLVAMIDDPVRDRKPIVQSVRDRYDAGFGSQGSTTFINPLLDQVESRIDDIHRRKQFIYRKFVIDENDYKLSWSHAVSQYLKSKRKNANPELILELAKVGKGAEKQNFKETVEFFRDFEERTQAIDFQNFLEFLSDEALNDNIGNAAQIKETLENLLKDNVNELEHFIEAYNEHLQDLEKEIQREIQNVLAELEKQKNTLTLQAGKLGNQNIIKSRNTWFSFVKLFMNLSDKLKDYIMIYEEVPNILQQTQESFNKLGKSFVTVAEPSVEDIKRHTKEVEIILSELRNELPSIGKTFFQNLFSESQLGVNVSKEIRNAINTRIKQVESINCSKTFQDAIHAPNSFTTMLKVLEVLLERTKSLKGALNSNFYAHFSWQKEYRAQNKILQKIVSLLRNQCASQWDSLLKEYMLQRLLVEKFNPDLTAGYDHELKRLTELKKRIQKQIAVNIPRTWKQEQSRLSRNDLIKSIFNLKGSKGSRRNSLRKIIHRDLDLFTAYYPVLMVNPSVCAQIVPFKPELFDYIIFDEASQLKIEDSITTLIRGHRKIVSGDKHQMPPNYTFTKGSDQVDEDYEDGDDSDADDGNLEVSDTEKEHYAADDWTLANSESLLEFAENCDFKLDSLDFHYRSHHPLLIEFSNAAFYKGKLNPLPERIANPPIQFIQMNGMYLDNQNVTEATTVIDILKLLSPNKEGDYPSIGIATFNSKQRDLIYTKINNEIDIDEEFAEKYLKLKEKGLFIKNLENIQGDERDVMIISTTFGYSPQNRFIQNFGPVNRSAHGRRLLNVLVTRARKKIFLVTSISKRYYSRYEAELLSSASSDKAYFYAWLAYAEAVSNEKVDEIRSILETLNPTPAINPDVYGLIESPFEESVYEALTTRIPEERIILQHKAGGFRIDIVIKSKCTNEPLLAIECDGATYHGSLDSYVWDMHRQSQLEEHGFIFHRIWSRDWWEDSDRELNKLVSFIQEHERKSRLVSTLDDPSTEHLQIESIEAEEIDETVTHFDDQAISDIKLPTSETAPDLISRQSTIEINEPIVEFRTPRAQTVQIGSSLKLKMLKDDKVMSIKLSKNGDGTKDDDGYLKVGVYTPLGASILNQPKGAKVEIGATGNFCQVMEIQ
jgi:superfamily I DNA and/or RNA helicase/very-short-patch-repair endonuclease